MSDLISRQAAIGAAIQAADEWDGFYPQDRNMKIRKAINNLPSEYLEPLPVCKHRLPCGNCDDLDMPCPVICQPWRGSEK